MQFKIDFIVQSKKKMLENLNLHFFSLPTSALLDNHIFQGSLLKNQQACAWQLSIPLYHL
jgi:hypothetical protein